MTKATRVSITPAAAELLKELKNKHGDLIFHQSGGCCDGSSPMCFPVSEFYIGSNDVKLGEVESVPFWMSRGQFEYWRHTHLTVDLVPGIGGMFSLDNGTGKRFLIRSRLLSEEELASFE